MFLSTTYLEDQHDLQFLCGAIELNAFVLTVLNASDLREAHCTPCIGHNFCPCFCFIG